MDKNPAWLLEYKKNVHSQTGEDGIIEKILDIIPNKDKWCVEFGAWDGKFLTNTCNLIDAKGYSAVLIESDRKRFRDLQGNYSHHDNVFTINKSVGFKEEDGLDHILQATPIPRDFDFLSIDIDGNDYHVWKAVSKYSPKIVAIEYNPTIPNPIPFIQPADPAIQQGASLLSIVELGRKKGYELVSVLPFNAFFVRREYYPLFHIRSNAPEVLRTTMDSITYIFSGYDGRIFLRGYRKLPWHGLNMNESMVQLLPKFLQRYPDNYNWLQKLLFNLYKLLNRK